MTAYMRADSIKVDDDEGRICLIVTDEDGGPDLQIDIHHLALEFWAQAGATLGNYAYEAEIARASMPGPVDEADGYDLSDPKHPTFHERMSEGVDMQAVERLERLSDEWSK